MAARQSDLKTVQGMQTLSDSKYLGAGTARAASGLSEEKTGIQGQ